MEAVDVLRAIARHVKAEMSDVRELFDEKGNLRPIAKLSDNALLTEWTK